MSQGFANTPRKSNGLGADSFCVVTTAGRAQTRGFLLQLGRVAATHPDRGDSHLCCPGEIGSLVRRQQPLPLTTGESATASIAQFQNHLVLALRMRYLRWGVSKQLGEALALKGRCLMQMTESEYSLSVLGFCSFRGCVQRFESLVLLDCEDRLCDEPPPFAITSLATRSLWQLK